MMSLATKKFFMSAWTAGLGFGIMRLIPLEMAVYSVGLVTMAAILGILLFYKDTGHWEVVGPLPTDMFTEAERKKLGRTTWKKEWVYD